MLRKIAIALAAASIAGAAAIPTDALAFGGGRGGGGFTEEAVSTAASAEVVSAVGLLIVALAAVASSGRGLVSVWVLASAITAAGAMPGHRMATGGSAVTPLTPTTDYSGSFRLAGVGISCGRWPPLRRSAGWRFDELDRRSLLTLRWPAGWGGFRRRSRRNAVQKTPSKIANRESDFPSFFALDFMYQ